MAGDVAERANYPDLAGVHGMDGVGNRCHHPNGGNKRSDCASCPLEGYGGRLVIVSVGVLVAVGLLLGLCAGSTCAYHEGCYHAQSRDQGQNDICHLILLSALLGQTRWIDPGFFVC